MKRCGMTPSIIDQVKKSLEKAKVRNNGECY
jgi:hypothetical protein